VLREWIQPHQLGWDPVFADGSVAPNVGIDLGRRAVWVPATAAKNVSWPNAATGIRSPSIVRGMSTPLASAATAVVAPAATTPASAPALTTDPADDLPTVSASAGLTTGVNVVGLVSRQDLDAGGCRRSWQSDHRRPEER